MINDKQVTKISLAIALIGIVAIYFLANVVGPANMAISEIGKEDAGKQVVINGTVVSARTTNGNLFMTLTDSKKNITVVMFESKSEPAVGNYVTVIGQVNIYKSTVEIIAKVVKWN